MIGEGSFVAAPFATALWLASSLPADVRLVIDVAALAVLFAGVFVSARYRAALSATDRERDAEKDRAERLEGERIRLANEKVELVAELAKEKARPDQSAVVALLTDMSAAMGEMTTVLSDIHRATVHK